MESASDCGRVTNGADGSPSEDAADSISRWIRGGGTQAENGAICGWRELHSALLSPPYPEITGYALTFFAQSSLTAHEADLAAAACEWLVRRTELGDFSGRPEKTGAVVYTFDVAMIAHGLISYGRVTGDDRLIVAGLRNVDVLVSQFDKHGMLPCVVLDSVTTALPVTWSTTGRAHLLKAVQAMLSAAEFGVHEAEDIASKLIRDVLMQENCFTVSPLITCPGSDRINLHALCYAAEGLWMWGTRSDDAEAMRSSRRITEWVWRQQLDDGGFPSYAHVEGGHLTTSRQSDVLCQAIRLAELHRLTQVDGDIAAATAAATDCLAQSMWRYGEQSAMYYWPQAENLHLNCWTSIFAVQALQLCTGGCHTLGWSELV